jgi:hypothetical protein
VLLPGAASRHHAASKLDPETHHHAKSLFLLFGSRLDETDVGVASSDNMAMSSGAHSESSVAARRKQSRKRGSPKKHGKKRLWDGASRLDVNHRVSAKDMHGEWYEACVSDCNDDEVRIHFMKWSTKLDEWMDRSSRCIAVLDSSEHADSPLLSRTQRGPAKQIAAAISSTAAGGSGANGIVEDDLAVGDGGRGKRRRQKKQIWDPTKKETNSVKVINAKQPHTNKAVATTRWRYGCGQPPCAQRCSFCQKGGDGSCGEGELLGPYGEDALYVHHMCAIWAPGVVEEERPHGRAVLEEVASAIETARANICMLCHNVGASIACCGGRLQIEASEGVSKDGPATVTPVATDGSQCGSRFHYACMVAAGAAPIAPSFSCVCPAHAATLDKATDSLARTIRRQVACETCNSACGADTLLYCISCGVRYHRDCVAGMETVDVAKSRPRWQCPACKTCHGCGGREDDERMVVCDKCDLSYHIYCIKTPLAAIPHGRWKCDTCVGCIHCGAIESTSWHSDYTSCFTCHEGSQPHLLCGVCNRAPESHPHDGTRTCATCPRWINRHCADGARCEAGLASVSSEQYVS